jgi:hypothetical protein
MLKKLLIILLSFNFCYGQLPDTDIWLFTIKNEKGILSIQKGENITNRPGYDNQPSFSPDGKLIYYVSIREDKQADIYTYNTSGKKITQLTRSKISEYSPMISPVNTVITTVAVLEDSSQVIYPIDNKTGEMSYYPNRKWEDVQINLFDSVGYYTFLNADTVLYYKLTKPHSLRARSLRNHTDILIAENPVRGFKTINRHEFIYGVKDSSHVTFYRYNTFLAKATRYCDFNSLGEDIVWHPQIGLLRSEGPKVLKYNEAQGQWESLFDFASFGISKITRFSFDPSTKKIAIVSNL